MLNSGRSLLHRDSSQGTMILNTLQLSVVPVLHIVLRNSKAEGAEEIILLTEALGKEGHMRQQSL